MSQTAQTHVTFCAEQLVRSLKDDTASVSGVIKQLIVTSAPLLKPGETGVLNTQAITRDPRFLLVRYHQGNYQVMRPGEQPHVVPVNDIGSIVRTGTRQGGVVTISNMAKRNNQLVHTAVHVFPTTQIEYPCVHSPVLPDGVGSGETWSAFGMLATAIVLASIIYYAANHNQQSQTQRRDYD